MEETIREILNTVFGNGCRLLDHCVISDGPRNYTCKLRCDGQENPLFLKLEKDFEIPATQQFQISREISALKLCAECDVPTPAFLAGDGAGKSVGFPWILEEFLEGSLISQFILSEEDKINLGREFELIFARLMRIEDDRYGDTFEGGVIGRHRIWCDAISRITDLLLRDCEKVGVFDKEAYDIVCKASQKALSAVICKSQPVLFHADLFSQNVMGVEREDGVHIRAIIDFGMSLFVPVHYAQYQTRRFSDFLMNPLNVQLTYGVNADEIAAYDILRMETILMMNMMKYNDVTTDYLSQTHSYIQKCREYIEN